MRLFGLPTVKEIGMLRRLVALFRKERSLLSLFSDITGKTSEGLLKEVNASVSEKAEKLGAAIRESVHS
jgi:hypothetical protein